MLQLFDPWESEVVVTMGPCGFIQVRLLIFWRYMGTSISLFKFLTRKWFWSLCPGLDACLMWIMVGWIVGSVRLSVSVLILFPIRLVTCLDYVSRLSMQVRKYFSVPDFIFFSHFVQFFPAFCSIVSLSIILLFYPFSSKGISQYPCVSWHCAFHNL